jgi:hypothetical protein
MIILAKNLEFSKLKERIASTSTRRRILRAGADREKSEKSSLTSSTSFLFNIFTELSKLFDICYFVSSRFYFTLSGYMEGGRRRRVEMFRWVSGGIQREQLIIEKERKKESTGFLFYLRFCHSASSSFSIPLFIFFLPLEGEIW